MRRMVLRTLAAVAVLLVSACAGAVTTREAPQGPVYPIAIETRRVPLGVGGATLEPGVSYAGGLSLHGSAVHGLSDLKLEADGLAAWSVSDLGSLFRFTLRLDPAGKLIGVEGGTRRFLTEPDGVLLTGKGRGDAEGLALFDDGRLVVSFERDHRIWSYGPAGAEAPAPLRRPDVAFPENEGMEGLAVAPDGGWLVLGEAGGAWTCDPSACRALPNAPTRFEANWRFTSADRDPAGGWFVLQRSYTAPFDMRARVYRMSQDGTLGPMLIELKAPASVDNFEGLAAHATPGGVRLYLLADDNANPLEKTLLLAFDVAE